MHLPGASLSPSEPSPKLGSPSWSKDSPGDSSSTISWGGLPHAWGMQEQCQQPREEGCTVALLLVLLPGLHGGEHASGRMSFIKVHAGSAPPRGDSRAGICTA